MTTTMTDIFNFERAGISYAGSALWKVVTPTGEEIGLVSRLQSKRGSSWSAISPGRNRSQGGFRSREAAAKYLEEMVGQ